jgi:RNA polymerase sigma factor (TIGR02999 family)
MVDPQQQHAAHLLEELQAGDPSAAAKLLPLVYAELRRLAAGFLRADRADHTLQPTALVHEAFLRLVRAPEAGFEGRAHFLAVAAKAMRQILVDHARARAAEKRGGDRRRETMAGLPEEGEPPIDVLDLEAALTKLAGSHQRPARVAELRFFAGLEIDAVAEVLAVSPRTVKEDWRFARAWLRRALEEGVEA